MKDKKIKNNYPSKTQYNTTCFFSHYFIFQAFIKQQKYIFKRRSLTNGLTFYLFYFLTYCIIFLSTLCL